MSGWEKDLTDAFLDEVEDPETLVKRLEAPAVAPDADLKKALLGGAQLTGRFARFADVAAELLDVSATQAAAILDRIDDPSAWYQSALPDMELVDLEGGPKVAQAITGFVRLPAGAHFPEHEHHGEEHVFVIQGSLEDGPTGTIYRPGEVATMPEGSKHDFVVRPGPDLVYLLVVQNGVTIAGQYFAHDDPRV